MKIFVWCRPRTYTNEATLRWFMHHFEQSGIPHAVNRAYAEHVERLTGIRLPVYDRLNERDLEDGAVMISVGGDGTFLDAVRDLAGLPMPIVGLNAGRLGFLAPIPPAELPVALDGIKRGDYRIEPRSMLTVSGDFGTTPEFPCALNEFTLHRHTADMIEIIAHVDGQQITIIRGDGAIVSTPTGSTAYSLSAGGPILAPDCACFVCTAIAPHNFSVRPLVIPDSSIFEMEVRTRGQKVLASIDNHSFIVDDGARFTIKKSESYTFLAHIQNISFYDTLKDRVSWGLDKRDIKPEKFWTDF